MRYHAPSTLSAPAMRPHEAPSSLEGRPWLSEPSHDAQHAHPSASPTRRRRPVLVHESHACVAGPVGRPGQALARSTRFWRQPAASQASQPQDPRSCCGLLLASDGKAGEWVRSKTTGVRPWSPLPSAGREPARSANNWSMQRQTARRAAQLLGIPDNALTVAPERQARRLWLSCHGTPGRRLRWRISTRHALFRQGGPARDLLRWEGWICCGTGRSFLRGTEMTIGGSGPSRSLPEGDMSRPIIRVPPRSQ